MTTEQRPPVSRRKLGIVGVVALIGAGLIVATGIRAREESGSRLREWTDNQAIPSVAVAFPSARALSPPSICRAGWKPIHAPRSLLASAAI